MAYTYNIPQASDQLSISQGQILGNFGALGAIAGNANANSASLNSTVGFNFVNMALLGVAPATGSNQMALFTLNNSNTAQQELYVQKQFSGTPIPLTAAATNGFGSPFGWTYLPSGIKMVWGTGTCNLGTVIIEYATAVPSFPGFTTAPSAPLLSRMSIGINPMVPVQNFVVLTNWTNLQFTVQTNATFTGTAQFSWLCMGF